MPIVRDLKAGDHFISEGGEVYQILCQGKDFAFTRRVSDGDETLYSHSGKLVSLASDSQIKLEGKVAVVRSIFEDSSTTRQAAEQIIDYLQAEKMAVTPALQEVADKLAERCTDRVKRDDDELLNGINALAGAAMAIAGSDTPNYKVKAAKCWPWEHPTHKDETPTQKFERVFHYGARHATMRDRLVWAAVLIIAEIEKQDRAEKVKNVG